MNGRRACQTALWGVLAVLLVCGGWLLSVNWRLVHQKVTLSQSLREISYDQAAESVPLEELKDMTDYYYRAHWAVVENRLRPETAIGDLNEEVVMERRRGLDWLFAPEDDWFEISLDT